jgi:uncharacterized protein (TIGR01777 family)
MKIIVTGASGLVGSALIPYLKAQGHNVFPLIRTTDPGHGDEIRWDPDKGFIDYRDLTAIDVVINLSGENIAEGRWTEEKKSHILYSRVNSTNFLAQVISTLEQKPKMLLNASAVGYYGSQGNAILTEKSDKGTGFLADVCSEWESAVDPARRAGIRTCLMRFGMVLSSQGGALASMVPPFKMGMGGRIGSGEQYMSWIGIGDLVRAVEFLITHNELEGPINIVSPYPVTNQEFTRELGRKLGRPTFFPLPAFLARIVFGEMADDLFLASQRVEPDKLIRAGFTFNEGTLKAALDKELA